MQGIISIQSHVVYGCAGNSAAVFPMQRAGFNVWPINTVQFSNHTQYQQGWKGKVLEQGEITELFDGLNNIGALAKTCGVISGYLGSRAQALEIAYNLDRVKKENSKVVYICDPVMGDTAKGCIVAPELTEVIRDVLIPKADIIVPNQYELSQITGIQINDIDTAIKAVESARLLGPSIVLVKHLQFFEQFTMMLGCNEGIYLVNRPLLEFNRAPVGVGDLTTALFASKCLNNEDLVSAFENTNQAIYNVLQTTSRLNEWELQLIDSQEHFKESSCASNAIKIK